jgi:hypothetical protein
MDFMWFTAGRGNLENENIGADLIKFDIVNYLTNQSSRQGGLIGRLKLQE